MKHLAFLRTGILILLITPPAGPGFRLAAAAWTPAIPLPAPRVIRSAEAYSGGGYEASNLVDGEGERGRRSEYASAGRGTETFVDFDLGDVAAISAFRHLERNDPATVKAAELLFSSDPSFSAVAARIAVRHAGVRSGETFVHFPAVRARYVRWRVTEISSHTTVGGASIGFYRTEPPHEAPRLITLEVRPMPVVRREAGEGGEDGESGASGAGGALLRLLALEIEHPYIEPAPARIEVSGRPPIAVELRTGGNRVEASTPAAAEGAAAGGAAGGSVVRVAVRVGDDLIAEETAPLPPVRPWQIHFLAHSHVDIGYTHEQAEVERLQWRNIERALELCRATADYPEGARFKWNVEVLWAVDGYLAQATAEKRAELIDAVRKGWIGLDALYGNQLTGLARPEELFRTVSFAKRLEAEHGLRIDSAMISDVPGLAWGVVPALASSGVKYFSSGPNHIPSLPHGGDRIGYTLETWGDRPFYWLSPSEKEKLLVWTAGHGYSWFHSWILGSIGKAGAQPILEYLDQLESDGYPYDLVQLRYTIAGDNGPPDPDLPEFVRAWNEQHVWPRMVISTT
ncbi:MAG: discoidin domain-containing protein, partial [Planctomycetes bacterium]|nr:discoidin domain-containing protein [Planctomycetota bacterium]